MKYFGIPLAIAAASLLFPAGPAHAETVRLKAGDELARSGLLRPGVHRYLRYTIEGNARTAIDIWTRRLSFENKDGRRLIHVTQHWDEAAPAGKTIDQDSWFEPMTFRPLTHVAVRTQNGKTTVAGYRYYPDRIVGLAGLPDNARKDFYMASPGPAFNFEYDIELLQALPLAPGYAATILFYDAGVDPRPDWYTFRVAGSDRIAGPDGHPVDCWLVTADYNKGKIVSRFWFDKRTQLMIREEETPADGSHWVKSLLPPEAADSSGMSR